jgi:hypothetical protein
MPRVAHLHRTLNVRLVGLLEFAMPFVALASGAGAKGS